MKKFLSLNYIYPLILVILTLIIIAKNYTPGTFLSGWDTLHPELNFPLNFSRLLNSVWHSEQGLGAVAGHSQMADLPRVFILWLFHFFLPLSTLRYSYIFLCLIIGPLGIYFLVKHLLNRHVALIAALFYLFNLGTLQQFYVPFEMFPTQWAFLPWIVLSTLKYLHHPHRRHLLFFCLATILATPQAYAAHLWYAFFGIFLLFIIIYSFLHHTKKILPLTLIFLTLCLNAFWLIPNIYFVTTSSNIPRENKTNRLHSPEFGLKNRETGTLSDTALVKGFYFNWEIFNFSQKKSENLLSPWNDHLKNEDVLFLGYLAFFASLTGLVITIVTKNRQALSFVPFFIIPFILLANRLPIFSAFFDALVKIPLLEETFRFIFTKISILFTFGLTIFIAYFFSFLFHFYPRLAKSKTTIGLIIISFIIYCYPYFQHLLISPKIQIQVPPAYSQFWDFMKQQPYGRVLTLPLHEPSGWEYYNWGYQGSGFIWFNLTQPILNRDFDRWNSANEESYREFFYSLYAKDAATFSSNLSKYRIKYLVWDQSLTTTSPKNIDQITFKNEIEQLLSDLTNTGQLKKINQFNQILVFQTNFPSHLFQINQIKNNIKPAIHWGFADTAYAQLGDYYTNLSLPSVNYPLRMVLQTNEQVNPIIFNQPIQVELPPLAQTEKTILADLYFSQDKSDQKITFHYYLPDVLSQQLPQSFPLPKSAIPTLTLNDYYFKLPQQVVTNFRLGLVHLYTNQANYLQGQSLKLDLNLPSTTSSFQYDWQSGLTIPAQDIYQANLGNVGLSLTGNLLTYQTQDITSGTNLIFNQLPHQSGYLIGIKAKYVSGIPLRICFKNTYSQICSINDEIKKTTHPEWNYYIAPPADSDSGYELELNTISVGGFPSLSQIEAIKITPLPFNLLNQAHTQNINFQANLASKLDSSGDIFLYQTQIPPSDTAQTLIFNQSYHPHWLAFYLDGLQPVFLSQHVLINNWANGWILPSSTDRSRPVLTIYILFWPQILQYIGFFLIPIPLIFLLRSRP